MALAAVGGVSVVRFFRPRVGAGFVRIDFKSTGWFWVRKHGNGTESSSPKAFVYPEEAVNNAGGDWAAEYFPEKEGPEQRLLDDIAASNEKPEMVRPSELVHRLRRLEMNEIGSEQRLLRALYDLCDAETIAKLPPLVSRRIQLLIDRKEIIRELECLPIDEDGSITPPKRAMYFILSCGKWYAAAAGEEKTSGSIRWLTARIDEPNGGSSTMPVRWPEWAHVTSDGTPNVDF